jgi:hypothetical protein
MARRCPKCESLVLPPNTYCGVCGPRIAAQNLSGLEAPIARLGELAKSKEQRLVELETTERVVAQSWRRLVLPVGAVILAIGILTQTPQKVLAAFPEFGGERLVRAPDGTIVDSSQKKPGETYMVLHIAASAKVRQTLSAITIANIESSLQDAHFKIFQDDLSLGVENSAGYQNVTTIGHSCVRTGPPCLIYFRPELKERAQQLQAMLRSIQVIPEDKVIYIPVDGYDRRASELLKKSGLDMFVVLVVSQ